VTYGPANTRSAFIPIFEYFPDDDDELRIKLSSVHTDTANALNVREIALYQNGQQTPTGQQFSIPGTPVNKSYAFRKVFYFDNIASGATLLIPHGLGATNVSIFTRITGGINTAKPDYRPLPFVSEATITDQVSVKADTTNIIIINGATAPDIINGIVKIEYLYA